MQLQEIDKSRYRRHYRIAFAAIVAALIVISLSSSALMIHFFGTADESNFWFNLSGVAIAAVLVSYIVYKLRHHPFMHELVYVWQLKQQLNQIYRQQRKIEPLLEQGDQDAMIIMNFMYRGSRQLYELDDNTITIDDLLLKIRRLESSMRDQDLDFSTDSYDPAMLQRFR